jgi:hypothetical protein
MLGLCYCAIAMGIIAAVSRIFVAPWMGYIKDYFAAGFKQFNGVLDFLGMMLADTSSSTQMLEEDISKQFELAGGVE